MEVTLAYDNDNTLDEVRTTSDIAIEKLASIDNLEYLASTVGETSITDTSITTKIRLQMDYKKIKTKDCLEDIRKNDSSIPNLYSTILSYQITKAVDEDSSDKDRREQGQNDTDEQRKSKALDRSGTEDEHNDGTDDRRDIGVQDRGKRALEAAGYSRRYHSVRAARRLDFFDPLEDDDVRVDSHTYTQDNAGDTVKGKFDPRNDSEEQNKKFGIDE